ncbi:MAG: hypothetical protein UZ14_CFX002002644 [Chloroflexi bacterium OLB14]|nr:MAG: hypothetical protein UZ14_CFX002002644 [Chloroflexi bacterium OLB14]
MCTMITQSVKIVGSGKHNNEWIKLQQANVSFDHPFHAPYEHTLNIDFVNESQRVAVELSESAARDLVQTILSVLHQAEAEGHIGKQSA